MAARCPKHYFHFMLSFQLHCFLLGSDGGYTSSGEAARSESLYRCSFGRFPGRVVLVWFVVSRWSLPDVAAARVLVLVVDTLTSPHRMVGEVPGFDGSRFV